MSYSKVSLAILNKPIVIFALKRNIHFAAVLLNEKSLYEILRVPENATQSEIKDAYYKLSKVYHPDVKKDEQALTMFRQITEAYDILGNVKSRIKYDKGIGKDMPFDTSKEPFYASLYAQNAEKGVRRVQPDKILDKKPFIDEFMANEYRDRLAEFQMAKKKMYPHYIKPYGNYGLQRALFCFFFSVGLLLARAYEFEVGF